jgi:3',5'-cyclic-AMP phosphodiesterase
VTFKIAHISDTHLSADRSYFTANFQRTVARLNEAPPDLVIHTGDISLDGAVRESDLREAHRLHGGLLAPVCFIPGNHDVGESQDAPPKQTPATTAGLRQRYLEVFGPDYWQRDVPGWRLIAVNAQLLGSDLPAARPQQEFIRTAVADSNGRSIALFVHKPLFHLSAGETAVTGRFINPVPRRQLLNAFGDCRIALVASGHVHQYLSISTEGVHYVWAPSTAFILPDDRQPVYGRKRVGFVEHLLEADGTHDSRLVALPEMQTLDISDFPDAFAPP